MSGCAPDVTHILSQGTAEAPKVEIVERPFHIELRAGAAGKQEPSVEADQFVGKNKRPVEDNSVEQRKQVLEFLQERSTGSSLTAHLVSQRDAHLETVEWTPRQLVADQPRVRKVLMRAQVGQKKRRLERTEVAEKRRQAYR